MNSRIARGLTVAVGALAVAGAALVAAPAASANGTLGITPQTGSGESALSVTTAGGCASPNATHYTVTLSGGSLTETINMNGVQPLAAIGAVGTQTTAMTAPVAYTIDMAQENYGSAIPTGVYDLNFNCRAALVPQAITVYTTKITIEQIAGGVAFTEGAKQLGVKNVTKPRVTGKAQVGATIKVSKGTWEPSDVTVKATWKIGKKTVSNGFSYKVKKSDRGKTIRVTVTASKQGFKPSTWIQTVRVAR